MSNNTVLSLNTIQTEEGRILVHTIKIENKELKDGGCHISFVTKPDFSPTEVAEMLVHSAKQLLAHVAVVDERE